ncbi:hypothetical protein FBY06_11830 [Pseudomonas sp. SJZ085]|uniref:DUF1566 domain-containing protein n=1 Tax=unclassified Pseudomonas TaxID=196821 RepID=UPI00119B4A0D|nr:MULTISPECIES: DUF1566 domain-containing protein [unclassified Pseudomonas]TWC17122.1 hypothetical protein FBX99_118114 [Pseudomonas sp. SJZ074]TWC35124.1 hypothetical protein FBY06_11830 [Pseudomonas sp. SJZ085]
MKAEMVKLEHNGIHFKVARPRLAEIAIAALFVSSIPPVANVPSAAPVTAPDLGEYWAGQGGINGGFVAARGDVPAHYLIFAAKDVGSLKWGGRGVEVKGLSKTDGHTNTEVLCNDDDNEYPAANACAEYQSDGHHDFYLPAAAELYQGWLNCPEVFAKDCYYWSSSQRSAYYAFYMEFADGGQYGDAKYNELRVRPVRRFFI